MKNKIFLLILIVFLSILHFFYKYNFQQNHNDYHINLNNIFHNNLDFAMTIPRNKIITIISAGDISLAKEINDLSLNTYKNFIWPFEKIAPLFRQTDISVVNLESPLLPDCISSAPEFYILCGNSQFISGLTYAGINVVNIANNHILDYGLKNAIKEVKLLKKAGMSVSGIDDQTFVKIKNKKIGFLGFNDIKYNTIQNSTQSITYQANNVNEVIAHVKKMSQKSDILIVSFHWGNEYTDQVTNRQKYLAHVAIDSGADLVLGNHPHWIQPIEVYKNKLIVYSHGSLIFNQKNFEMINQSNEKTKTGLIGKYYFLDKSIVGVEFIPIKIDSSNQPYILENNEKKQVLKMLEEKSHQLTK